MLDATVTQLIDEVVGLWISQGRAFTAYEISKEVQARIKEQKMPFVRHLEMRDYYGACQPLLDEVAFGSYNATLIDVGAPEKANLFHPDTYDPKNYVPMPRQKNVGILPPVVGAGGAVATGAQLPNMIFTPSSNGHGGSTTVVSPQKGVHTVNQGDELWIGSQHLASVGLLPGDTIHFTQDGNKVYLYKTLPVGTTAAKTLIVEQKGNSRLSRQVRQSLGFDGNKFSITTEADRITISEV